MNAARHTAPQPDMSGISDDWQRTLAARRHAERPVDEPEGPEDDATAPRGHDATDEGGHATAAAKRRRGKAARPAPRVIDAVAMSVRVDPAEAREIDRFVLELRDETGQRLDKAEVVRELLRLAQFDPTVRRKLVRRLR